MKFTEGEIGEKETEKLREIIKMTNSFIYDNIKKMKLGDQKEEMIAHYAIVKGLKEIAEYAFKEMGITVDMEIKKVR